MRSRYKIIEAPEGCNIIFATSTIVDWTPLLFKDDLLDIILQSLKFCQKEKGLEIYGYVIMPNHFHLLAGHKTRKAMPGIIRDMKKHTAKEIIKYLKGLGTYGEMPWIRPFHAEKPSMVWQPGYHPQAVFSQPVFSEKLKYIHGNPVKQGFVERPEHWKYSSARNYILDDHSLVVLDTERL
ncbi:MAG: transposase [Nitrospinae bacterium]|nr:transposase [Nitrospinota bacterium]